MVKDLPNLAAIVGAASAASAAFDGGGVGVAPLSEFGEVLTLIRHDV